MSELNEKKEETESCSLQYINEKSQNETEPQKGEEVAKAKMQSYGHHREQQRVVTAYPAYVQTGQQGYEANQRDTYRYGRPGRNASDDFFIMEGFDDRTIRHRFVRKVYTLLSLQLLCTFGLIILCSMVRDIKYLMMEYYYMVFVSLFVGIILVCALACCESLRRTTPINFILLAMFTLFFGYTFAFMSIFYKTQIVFLALLITVVVCVCITIFAIQTSWDVTGCGIYLFVSLILVMVFGSVMSIVYFFTRIELLEVVYAALIGLIFCMYLIYDTQMIIGGRRIELSPEEYIMGALQLYIDVMQLFYAILRIIGGGGGR